MTSSVPTATPEEQLLFAALNGDLDTARQLLEEHDADPVCPDDEGRTTLFFAASNGHLPMCQLLIQSGHPWNTLDVHGRTAAEYALVNGHEQVYEWLVTEGVRSERLFDSLRKMGMMPDLEDTNADYLTQKLVYTDDGDRLLDAKGNGVMMGWETPLMQASVDRIVTGKGQKVLNVGFGLGIIDKMIQSCEPSEHHIIEAHPDVLAHIATLPLFNKTNPTVTVHKGTWREVIPALVASHAGHFDAIYFDTYGEYYQDLAEFHHAAQQLLAPGGRYSWFHGGGASNAVFNEVYRRISTDDISNLELEVEWEKLDMAPLGDEVWQGIRLNYFSLNHYWLPVATKPVTADAE
ncbi:S-adenosyl-L-methionine-dependent methyltransferase [Catenaria anguillulae PL171]|uniref:S-adenosyl-L-methionine-dependent methyltransferase n=1 Tax=Catenaria anguillulae PL171 TaxID=765915 RepID=A0A1Y2HR78_9FUNG|nr:S-adenosyl-L-methionine-dependent methyltransferase [Catenaria anguillulae PL171]